MEKTCLRCGAHVAEESYFCQNCGEKIKEKPLSTSLGRQILIYLISALLPPLGLWPAVKYLKQKDGKSRKIGIAAIIITAVSLAVTIWLTANFINAVNQSLGSLDNLNF